MARDSRPWEQAQAARLTPKQAQKGENGTAQAKAKATPATPGRRKLAKAKA